MPKFFYTLILLMLISLGLGGYTVLYLRPDSPLSLGLFFLALLSFQTFFLANLSFWIATRFFHRLKERATLRPLLRRSFLFSLGTTGAAGLRALKILTWPNLALWLAFLILLEIRLSQTRSPDRKPLKNLFLRR